METIKRALTESEIEALNKKYHPLTPTQRIAELYNDFDAAEVMLTSSSVATSAYLLKLFSEINREQTVLFIDTGYHFRETLIYKDYLEQLYQLNVRSVRAEDWKHDFTNKDETWTKDPDLCCSINKVEPLQALKDAHTVWVSGLMAWQSNHRATLDIFEQRSG